MLPKTVSSVMCGKNVLWISIRVIWPMMPFISSVSLIIFCPLGKIHIEVTTVTVSGLICDLMPRSVCCIKLGAANFGGLVCRITMSSWWSGMKWLFLFGLAWVWGHLCWFRAARSACFLVPFAWIIFFPSFSLVKKERFISCRQQKGRHDFLILWACLCLFTEELNQSGQKRLGFLPDVGSQYSQVSIAGFLGQSGWG